MTAAKLYPGVRHGVDHAFGAGAIIGLPLDGEPPGLRELVLGEGANIRSHAVLYAGSHIGARFHAGHGALIREGCEIGDGVSIGSGTEVCHHVRIGNGVRVHSRAFICEFSELQAGCWIGPGALLLNSKHPNRIDSKERLAAPVIRPGAVIGAGAIIMPGIIVGERAIVGAGAVVTHEVKPGATVVGNPARVLRDGLMTEVKYAPGTAL